MTAGHVLVTGATGALGPAVVRCLLDRGRLVRVLVRHDDVPVDTRAERVRGDLMDRASLDRAVSGVDGVVHLAALLHVVNPPPSLRDLYWRVNVDGTTALLEAAGGAGVRRFVFASTTAVYGATEVPSTEDTPPAPDSWYAASKLDAEREVRARHRAGAFDAAVLRVSAIYGPRIKGNYQRLLLALAAGRFVPIGRGQHRRSLVYEDDVATAFALAIDRGFVEAPVLNVTDGTPHALADIIGSMCRALDRRPPRLSLPEAPVRAGAAVAARVWRLVRDRPPAVVSAVAKYLEPSVVDATRIGRDLGFSAEVDLDTGWRRTVEALRAAGALPPRGR